MKKLLLALSLLFSASGAYAQPSDTYLLNRMTAGRMPGASMVIIKDGHWVFDRSLGKADLANNKDVTRETVFMLASISKTMIATAVMQLWEKNLVDLDANVNAWLPFQLQHPQHPTDSITLRMLLTHTSSIQDNWGVMGPLYVYGDSPISLDSYMEDYFSTTGAYYNATDNFYSYQPGTQHNYSNMGSTLAAYIVERVTGDEFHHYCDTAIFQKLCMKNTSFLLAGIPDTNLIARPYTYSGTYDDVGLYGYPDYPDGQLRTTIKGLARFMTMYLQWGEFEGERILDSTTVAYILQQQTPVDPGQGIIFYAGQSSNGDVLWGHNGGDVGVSTAMYFNMDKKTGAIVLTNGEGSPQSYPDLMVDTLYKYGLTVTPAATDTFPACDELTSISELPLATSMGIYPNPADDYIEITSDGTGSQTLTVRIIDMQGRTALQSPLGKDNKVDVHMLPAGVYQVLIKDDQHRLRGRVGMVKR